MAHSLLYHDLVKSLVFTNTYINKSSTAGINLKLRSALCSTQASLYVLWTMHIYIPCEECLYVGASLDPECWWES